MTQTWPAKESLSRTRSVFSAANFSPASFRRAISCRFSGLLKWPISSRAVVSPMPSMAAKICQSFFWAAAMILSMVSNPWAMRSPATAAATPSNPRAASTLAKGWDLLISMLARMRANFFFLESLFPGQQTVHRRCKYRGCFGPSPWRTGKRWSFLPGFRYPSAPWRKNN